MRADSSAEATRLSTLNRSLVTREFTSNSIVEKPPENDSRNDRRQVVLQGKLRSDRPIKETGI